MRRILARIRQWWERYRLPPIQWVTDMTADESTAWHMKMEQDCFFGHLLPISNTKCRKDYPQEAEGYIKAAYSQRMEHKWVKVLLTRVCGKHKVDLGSWAHTDGDVDQLWQLEAGINECSNCVPMSQSDPFYQCARGAWDTQEGVHA